MSERYHQHPNLKQIALCIFWHIRKHWINMSKIWLDESSNKLFFKPTLSNKRWMFNEKILMKDDKNFDCPDSILKHISICLQLSVFLIFLKTYLQRYKFTTENSINMTIMVNKAIQKLLFEQCFMHLKTPVLINQLQLHERSSGTCLYIQRGMQQWMGVILNYSIAYGSYR